MSKKNIIPVFVPHYGCPNDCIFCNQRKITNKSYVNDLKQTKLDIKEYLTFFSDKKNNTQIAFYGGSFTGLPEEIMIEYLKLANEFIEIGKVDSIRLSTRPDYIDTHILDILKKYNVDTIELGVQSLDDEVLIYNNRGHNAECVYKASKLIKDYGIKLGLQQMVGLYKDDYNKNIFTAKEFVKIKPAVVRIYPTLIIKETELERIYKEGNYIPLTVEESVKIIKILYMIYYIKGIDIIRIGLQPTDNINEGKDIVAGPFHAAYRQLVLQDIFKDILYNIFLERKNNSDVKIYCNNKNISYIVGNKGSNKKFLFEEFKVKNIKFINNNSDEIFIEIDGIKMEIDIFDYFKNFLESAGVFI